MASSIPAHASLDFLSSVDWNTLTSLNTGVGVYAAGGAWYGTLPSLTAPNFLIGAGYGSVTFTAGSGSLLFTAFPRGVLAVVLTGNSAADVTLTTQGTPSPAGVGVYATSNGTAFTGTIGIHYIAIGF